MNLWGVRFVPRSGRSRVAVLLSCATLAATLAGTGANADLPLPSCTNQPLPGAAPAGETMLFDDEFVAPNETKACPLRWNYEIGGQWANNEQQGYANNASYAQIDNGPVGGYLSINAKKVDYHDPIADAQAANPLGSYTEPHYTSGRLDTYGNFQFTYGHIEAKIWTSGGATWPAFWLLGTACAPTYNANHPAWPDCGEIDIMERFAEQPTINHATVHQPFVSTAAVKDEWTRGGSYNAGVDLSAGWHTYAADIRNNSISFTFDGNRYGTVCGRLDQMFDNDTPTGKIWGVDHPWYIVMNVAVGGDHGGTPSTSTFPQSMKVDYVRVWTDPSYAENADC